MKQVVKRPLISEKSYQLANDHKYCFSVDTSATKDDVKKMVEKLFGVTVVKVNSLCQAGKVKRTKRVLGRRQNTKKVIVTLDKKQSISLFEIEKEEEKSPKKEKAIKTQSNEEKSTEEKDVEVTIKSKSTKKNK